MYNSAMVKLYHYVFVLINSLELRCAAYLHRCKLREMFAILAFVFKFLVNENYPFFEMFFSFHLCAYDCTTRMKILRK